MKQHFLILYRDVQYWKDIHGNPVQTVTVPSEKEAREMELQAEKKKSFVRGWTFGCLVTAAVFISLIVYYLNFYKPQ